MKKIPMMSKVFCVLGVLMSIASLRADDCCPSLFDCGGCWSYQIRVGVYPTIWRSRPHLFLNSCDCATGAAVTGADLGELPKFNKFFKLPWIVSSQIIYDWNDCWSLYGELDYIQSRRKDELRNTVSAVNPALAIRLGTYRAISGYVGAKYNFHDWCGCDNFSFYLGAKIGFIYRQSTLAHQLTVAPTPAPACACPSPFKRDFFRHKAKISGGGSLWFVYGWCNCWSLVLMGEVVASGGPRGNACIPLTNTEVVQLAGGANLGLNKIKTEISFPVTLGLKYDF
jgi:hypothetical protein